MGTLQQMIDSTIRAARIQFAAHGAQHPVFIIETEEDKLIFFEPPGRLSKDDFITIARHIMRERRALRYVYVSEVWMKTYEKDDPLPADGRVEHEPGREEAIMFSAESRTEPPIVGSMRIVRDADGARLEPFTPIDLASGETTGLFVGLLPQEKVQ